MTVDHGAGAAQAAVSARRTLAAEIAGLAQVERALDGALGGDFAAAVDRLQHATGRLCVCGMGKSGHVARKIAATFASTGAPAYFLHPAEAAHGDLGMVAEGDVVLALSWSGGTEELKVVIDHCKRFGVYLIGVTAAPESALAAASDLTLVLPAAAEACPNGLAPTTSTTMQMALGDALAVALLEARGFSAEAFRVFHPGGRLGARLLHVREVMAPAPAVSPDTPLSAAIVAMSNGRLGGVAVVDPDGRLVGAFTDGDLRRALPQVDLNAPVASLMTRTPVAVDPDIPASEALRVMNAREHPILLLFVCAGERLVGAVHMHDLLRAGVA